MPDSLALRPANHRATTQWERVAEQITANAESGAATGEIVIRLKLVNGIVKKFAVVLELEQYVTADSSP